jgi:FtsH-binding integral membrane protein
MPSTSLAHPCLAARTHARTRAPRQLRHAFLRKVLALVMLQLLATAALAMPITSHKAARAFLHANPWVFGLAAIIAATLLLVLACSEAARRVHPTNLLLLGAFTAAEGAMVGTASATYQTHVLVVGLLIAASVCLALIAYASQTSADFTASGGILFSAAVVLLVVSLADACLGFKPLVLLIGGCGALLFCAYLVYDVQLLASGDSAYAVAADEYVFGAINVHTDVISAFLHVLRVLGRLQADADDMH